MRKVLVLSLLALSIISNSSCAPTPKISVEINQEVQSTIEIDYPILQTMMNSDQEFILYVYDTFCTSCLEFRPVLLEVIETHHLVIYAVISSSLVDSLTIQYTPTLFTIANGEVVSSIDMYHQPNSFASASQFEHYLESVVDWSS
ncbi:MAG: hypothetical protein WCS53_03940 [Bacilli bacterium]|jgi:hypothetical protein